MPLHLFQKGAQTYLGAAGAAKGLSTSVVDAAWSQSADGSAEMEPFSVALVPLPGLAPADALLCWHRACLQLITGCLWHC